MSFYLAKMEALRRQARHTPELDFTPPLPAEGKTIEERFRDFDSKNPQVFMNILVLARARVRAGRRLSMKGIFEDLREAWQKVDTKSDYRLDNTWTSFYSRKLTREYPEFIGLIEQRKNKETV